jgi:hypothetical protein
MARLSILPDMEKKISRQRKINEIFLGITGIAEPGDVIFGITHYPNSVINGRVNSKISGNNFRDRMMRLWKPWAGFDREDSDAWHVGIYLMGKKRKHHTRRNIWILHSVHIKGVTVQHLTPRSFSNKNKDGMSRVEILECKGINEEQRGEIVRFSNSKIGSEFDSARMRNAILTNAFGLPNVFHDQKKFSCQQLAIAAYATAGIHIPHPYKAFPIFNIARYLGHPLGHPKDRVDPMYPYLMDHHIYRDPRFVLKAAVYQDPTTDEIILQTENLKKYSWDESLREKYIKKGYLDP